MKRFLSLFLALILAVSCLAVTAYADTGSLVIDDNRFIDLVPYLSNSGFSITSSNTVSPDFEFTFGSRRIYSVDVTFTYSGTFSGSLSVRLGSKWYPLTVRYVGYNTYRAYGVTDQLPGNQYWKGHSSSSIAFDFGAPGGGSAYVSLLKCNLGVIPFNSYPISTANVTIDSLGNVSAQDSYVYDGSSLNITSGSLSNTAPYILASVWIPEANWIGFDYIDFSMLFNNLMVISATATVGSSANVLPLAVSHVSDYSQSSVVVSNFVVDLSSVDRAKQGGGVYLELTLQPRGTGSSFISTIRLESINGHITISDPNDAGLLSQILVSLSGGFASVLTALDNLNFSFDFQPVVDAIGDHYVNLRSSLVNLFNQLAINISNQTTAIQGFFSDLSSTISSGFSTLYDSLRTTLINLFTTVRGAISDQTTSIQGFFSDLFDTLSEQHDHLINWLAGRWMDLSSWILATTNAVTDGFANLTQPLFKLLTDSLYKIGGWFEELRLAILGNPSDLEDTQDQISDSIDDLQQSQDILDSVTLPPAEGVTGDIGDVVSLDSVLLVTSPFASLFTNDIFSVMLFVSLTLMLGSYVLFGKKA